MKVLVLGGTAEARGLADALGARPGTEVVVSLAGHTSAPVDHAGARRVGGFGGVDGLARFLADERIDALVDATHPFAATMAANAAAAVGRCPVPRLRLVRPPWAPVDGDRWIDADDLAGAAAVVRDLGAVRVLLTVGRLELGAFAGIDRVRFVVRSIEPPGPLPFEADVVLGRGPFTVADELDLLRSRGIDALVTKNSGGDDAKLVAARELGLPVVMVRRPPMVAGESVPDVEAALRWLDAGA
ncbi:MAG: cobalt-precorrin-6A reductase [Actinomycetota bacterium]|nr:cobalt-precorrin-6A reductase [Actinomycetota bacterium]